ncbi:hypothetical protein ES319_D04G127800v1 [Gossypium barbadense]|uniref:MSP domain-containing protein n=3 Tax=Gossypium TaxID=3633 RepID=A0A5J5RVN8_GOSBA|nr:hypothetical protein ES319_D04G127800v1 [Gossypium barbadense]TYG73868.1 hypothetical protein ES288_D04G136100v1 [Gossypium darwinii]TYH77232.1 hypothetical protein ES332_D04G138900v1 [Gossypium tomentosum]
MRPPGAILVPDESIIATVFKFVEPPENNEKQMDQKSRVKFKIMSLKVKGPMDYIPELFDEQKDQVAIEQILRVVFLDPERPCPLSPISLLLPFPQLYVPSFTFASAFRHLHINNFHNADA